MDSAAAIGFDRSAAAYERGRPGYPQAAVDWLAERVELGRERTVVDLAAGTGKLTRLLLATGAQVIAIEPVDAMRARLADHAPGADALPGTAEAIPLAPATADVVTVAQAFHWFDGPAALSEISRVLRPGGWLALVWNRRELEHPLHRQISAIIDPYRGDTPSHHREQWRVPLADSTVFAAAGEQVFAHAQDLDEDGLLDRVLSTSFIAALPDEPRQQVSDALRRLARLHGGRVTLAYRCELQLFARSD